MAFEANVIKVLVASPGDTLEERTAIERAVTGWNGSRAEASKAVYSPWLWERHAVPLLGAHPQKIINEQAVDTCDVVIAVFDSRLGSETDEAVSGTAEEITRAHEAGKPVHVWFSGSHLPRNVDADQLKKLDAFKERLSNLGLLGTYANSDDLQYQVHRALESDLARLDLGEPNLPTARRQSAKIRGKVIKSQRQKVDSKGKIKFESQYELIIANESDVVTAENLTIDFGDFQSLIYLESPEKLQLRPSDDFSWPMAVHMGAPDYTTLTFHWEEDGESYEDSQIVRLG